MVQQCCQLASNDDEIQPVDVPASDITHNSPRTEEQ